MSNAIRPDHYREGVRFDPIAVAQEWGLSFCLGSALKYMKRCGKKPGADPVEDIDKAIEFLNREREYLKARLMGAAEREGAC